MKKAPSWLVRSFCVVLIAIGLLLAGGGMKLIAIGGSPYYFIAGTTVMISGVMLWRSKSGAAFAYALLLAGTLFWALAEAGLDAWRLTPRLVGPAVLGLMFLLPPLRRVVGRTPAITVGIAAIACLGTVGLAVLLPGPNSVPDRDVRLQPITQTDNAGEWPEFGRVPRQHLWHKIEVVI